ncbi:SEC-C metal-binding domain-containing protein [Bacillales bacterium AN1005]
MKLSDVRKFENEDDFYEHLLRLMKVSIKFAKNMNEQNQLVMPEYMIRELNIKLKKRYNKLKSKKLNEMCPCGSEVKYYECCFEKLKHFTYSDFTHYPSKA